MLATRISFMNEIANVCERFGADVDKVRQAIASDKRIGPAFLFPGVGYGGSCFPEGRQGDHQVRVGQEIQVQDPRRRRGRQRDAEAAAARSRSTSTSARSLKGKTIAVWGLAFKPRTDDMREAPAMPIIKGCSRAARRCGRSIPRRKQRRASASSRSKIYYAKQRLRRAQGRRRAARRDRVERVPRAGFREDEAADEAAGDLRRPQHLRPAADSRARASPTRRSAGHERGARHRWRRLRRQPRRQGAGGRRLRRRRLRQSVGGPRRSGRPHRRRVSGAAVTLVAGDILDARRGPPGAARRRAPTAVMHFAARLLGRRVGARAARLLPGQRRPARSACSAAMAEAGVQRFVFSSTAATFGEPQTTPIDEIAPAAADQRLRRNEAGGRARAAAPRARVRHPHAIALRYFNAAGADPDGADRRRPSIPKNT